MARTAVPFAGKISKPLKRRTGRGGASETPLHVRTKGAAVEAGLSDYVRTKLGRRLGKFARAIERVSVRIDDVNGPRGGIDTVARIKIVLSARPSVVVESRGTDARHALDLASHRAERTLRRSLGRAGVTAGRPTAASATPPRGEEARPASSPFPPLPEGSLIGARVGRSAANLARTMSWRPVVDTSKPGVSATHRKAGGGSTAARNVKHTSSRATAALEDSATGTPSRKSTRRSANRAKSGDKQQQRAKALAASPQRRASRPSKGG